MGDAFFLSVVPEGAEITRPGRDGRVRGPVRNETGRGVAAAPRLDGGSHVEIYWQADPMRLVPQSIIRQPVCQSPPKRKMLPFEIKPFEGS